jgi:hypothetical protein
MLVFMLVSLLKHSVPLANSSSDRSFRQLDILSTVTKMSYSIKRRGRSKPNLPLRLGQVFLIRLVEQQVDEMS